MGYDYQQFRDLIYRRLKLHDLPRKPEAIDLLCGTAAQESAFGYYLRQTNGPALGPFQMEPATFQDLALWAFRKFPLVLEGRYPQELEYDLDLAIVSARLNYLRKPGSIPTTYEGQAQYWKDHWNTHLGKGTVQQYLKNWQKFCRGMLPDGA